jgi:hypothetical protein
MGIKKDSSSVSLYHKAISRGMISEVLKSIANMPDSRAIRYLCMIATPVDNCHPDRRALQPSDTWFDPFHRQSVDMPILFNPVHALICPETENVNYPLCPGRGIPVIA